MNLKPVIAAVAASMVAFAAAHSRSEVLLGGRRVADGDGGRGWTFKEGELRLSGAKGAVLSGTATNGEMRICVDKPSSLSISNLVLSAPASGQCALLLAPGASLDLSAAGTNSFSSGPDRAGIEVPSGAALRVAGAGKGAAVEAHGGASAAGVGGTGGFGDGGSCGDVSAEGDVRLLAFGGSNGAGIGGGWGGDGGTVSASGGAAIEATGGWNAPGIGGGRDGRGGAIAVSMARIVARGGASAPGLAGRVRIDGGCVSASAGPGSDGTPDAVFPPDDSAGLLLSSGTFFAAPSRISGRAAKPDGTPLSPFAIPLGTHSIETLEAAAGLDLSGVEPDGGGTVVAWLPPHVSEIRLGGEVVVLRERPAPTSVLVNGADAAEGAGPGWTWTEPELRLSGDGPFALAGTNADGRVCVMVDSPDCRIRLDGLSIDVSHGAAPALRIAKGAAARIELAGTNSLVSGRGCAGLQVEEGASVRLGAAKDLEEGAPAVLVTAGGRQGAGIGGGVRGSAGSVAIDSGEIVAAGGLEGAGIGGGSWGNGGDVEISGGFVRALAGADAAAVGGGKFCPAGSFKMSGGTVVPDAQPECALVGGGLGAPKQALGGNEITGGSLVANAGRVLPAPGRDGEAFITRRGRQFRRIALWRARAAVGVTNAPVEVTGLRDYATRDVFGGPSGEVVFWLPEGDHAFATADGRRFVAHVGPDDVAKAGFRPEIGVAVNGTDIAAGGGFSWRWDGRRIEFNGPGPFVVSGHAASPGVTMHVPGGNRTEITASNLVFTAAPGSPAIELGRGARLDCEICGDCELRGGDGATAAVVAEGSRLSFLRGLSGSLDLVAGDGAAAAFAPAEDGAPGEIALGRGVSSDRPPTPDSGTRIRMETTR